MSSAGLFVLVLFLATLTEWVVERFFSDIAKLKGKWMVLISTLVGVALCFGFSVDGLSLVGFDGQYPHWLGVLITGIIVGSGANAIHKFFKPSEPIPPA